MYSSPEHHYQVPFDVPASHRLVVSVRYGLSLTEKHMHEHFHYEVTEWSTVFMLCAGYLSARYDRFSPRQPVSTHKGSCDEGFRMMTPTFPHFFPDLTVVLQHQHVPYIIFSPF